MHHLHQTCITCISPANPASTIASPASALHHAQKAASTLHQHQPRTGCITRTRELGKPKHQAPNTQVTRNHPYARCPLPHRNTEETGGGSFQPARARTCARARGARERQPARERAHARERGRGLTKSTRMRGLPPARRVDRTVRHVTPPRATCVVRPLGRALPPAHGGGRMERGFASPAECGAKNDSSEQPEGSIITCSTAAVRTTRDRRTHHAHPTARTSPAPRSTRARVARGGVGAKRRRDTRTMTDDGRNGIILHREMRTLPTPAWLPSRGA